jgi:LCP family protein required for cell wall assembly
VSLIPRTRGGALWRFLFAAVIVIMLTAGTTAVAGLLEVKTVIGYINQNAAIPHAPVEPPAPGAPETLLLIGSDHRAGEPYSDANTDTMMLVRLDDSSSTINVLSIPRDLAVMLPYGDGEGEGKLNAAYSLGGVSLLVHTLKHQVFPGMQINHILDVNFAGFSDLIDAIGCVYTDVDHRYYNNTVYTDYSSIDIQPGYQKLCGDNQSPSGALAFVRFRHTDSDVVRNARQQDFLRWAKEGYSSGQLLANEAKLLSIFGKHVQTDHSLHTTDGLLDLFNVVFNADGHTVKSIPFPEYFGVCGGSDAQTPCYVYADDSGPEGTLGIGEPTPAEEEAYRRFLTPTVAPAPNTSTTPTTSTVTVLPGKTKPITRPHHQPSMARYDAGLIADVGDGKSQSAMLPRAGMPVLYPSLIVAGAQYCFSISADCDDPSEPQSAYEHSYPRQYVIHAPDGAAHAAYVMTVDINSALGEYYTVQGTTWRDPPIFSSPLKVQVIGGRKLFEYFDGQRIALVAYKTAGGVYWISNTLANNISNNQMIGLAASLTPAG